MKIVICGGGTAGWLSALFLSKIHPDNEYVLIQSKEIGVIGTGEGSTGVLRDVLRNVIWNFGINEEDFVKSTGSTPKMGIEFKNWGDHNYISALDGSRTSTETPDAFTLYGILNNFPPENSTRQGLRAKYGKIFSTPNQPLLNTDGGAYHFDGVAVSQFLRSKCDNVEVVEGLIEGVDQDRAKNIRTINCSGITIDNIDLVIDCLGINSPISKQINKGWVSYEKHLPVNSAILFRKPNGDLENTKPLTISTALKCGWLFEIPVADRYGCGYVYCDKYCTEEDARKELEDLGYSVDIGTYRHMKFNTGRVKNFWKNNVISVGLSSGFIEPLQATSIHTTIAHLNLICFSVLSATKKNLNKQSSWYNIQAAKYFDDFADFVNLHYQCGREDTDFWKYMTKKSATPFVKSIINLCKSRVPDIDDYPTYPLAASSLWNSTLHGLGLISKKVAKEQLDFYERVKNITKVLENEYDNHQNYFKNHDTAHSMKKFMYDNYIEPEIFEEDDMLDVLIEQVKSGNLPDCDSCMPDK